ncbi:hypothetical protein RB614_39095 [Phytohabitans sp. ZYX-F-186]|uniref:Uncharacterized protein n=1 Tax=Phytohabitans maris TaxID=3071409 RepID=A0ABU0ZWD4_9ACTN|nr:hypothetical protein [Phytohabitans sp. ZYX-F-186]MDQ7910520.1 hypothetical protein [Phytohabitans sp. ZYX-F-186]
MANTIAETIELLYGINQETLTIDQQIALAQAYAAFAQAERLEMINQRLYSIHQVLNGIALRVAQP